MFYNQNYLEAYITINVILTKIILRFKINVNRVLIQ